MSSTEELKLSKVNIPQRGYMIGPKGEKGEKGEQGKQGERGLRGFKGDPGPRGTQGPIGRTPVKWYECFTADDIKDLERLVFDGIVVQETTLKLIL